MQTFLPSTDYEYSAQALDNKRLNKQILEGYQILKVLLGASPSGAWRNHPAVLMWKHAEQELINYIDHMIYEADWRGIKTDTNRKNIKELISTHRDKIGTSVPFWLNDLEISRRLTTTHRANLYIKDPIVYAKYKVDVDSAYNVPCCDGCKYYWVTHPLRKVK